MLPFPRHNTLENILTPIHPTVNVFTMIALYVNFTCVLAPTRTLLFDTASVYSDNYVFDLGEFCLVRLTVCSALHSSLHFGAFVRDHFLLV